MSEEKLPQDNSNNVNLFLNAKSETNKASVTDIPGEDAISRAMKPRANESLTVPESGAVDSGQICLNLKELPDETLDNLNRAAEKIGLTPVVRPKPKQQPPQPLTQADIDRIRRIGNCDDLIAVIERNAELIQQIELDKSLTKRGTNLEALAAKEFVAALEKNIRPKSTWKKFLGWLKSKG